MDLDKIFWENRYKTNEIGWDVGYITDPLKFYIDQISNKSLKILIPGCGNAYELEYLFRNGFKNCYGAELTESAKNDFFKRNPEFEKVNWLQKDFFDLNDTYDLIIEQTFFCALQPNLREKYVLQMKKLLKTDGKLVGLLFDDKLNDDKPPFGGNKDEYLKLFQPHFHILKMEKAYNSIPPRTGRELFIVLQPKI